MAMTTGKDSTRYPGPKRAVPAHVEARWNGPRPQKKRALPPSSAGTRHPISGRRPKHTTA
jgi:hypothetical protein